MLTYFQNKEIKLRIFSYSYGIGEGKQTVKKGRGKGDFIGILLLCSSDCTNLSQYSPFISTEWQITHTLASFRSMYISLHFRLQHEAQKTWEKTEYTELTGSQYQRSKLLLTNTDQNWTMLSTKLQNQKTAIQEARTQNQEWYLQICQQ